MTPPIKRLAASLAALVLLAGCATQPAPSTIADTAARTPQLSTLSSLIAQAGLSETLRGPGPYTVFAPNNDAFKALPAATMSKLAVDKELLRSVLTYHVVPGKTMAAQVGSTKVKTVNGAEINLSRTGTFVAVEDAVVVAADVPATNGVVHIVDRVLIPPAQK